MCGDGKIVISVVAAVVEGAVGDEDVCGASLLVAPALLRAQHYQRQLTSRLPDLLLLSDLFSVGGTVSSALVVPAFGLLDIIDLVAVVVGGAVDVVVLFLPLHYGSTPQYVEACLGFGHEVAVLVLFETDVLLLELFLGGLMALVD